MNKLRKREVSSERLDRGKPTIAHAQVELVKVDGSKHELSMSASIQPLTAAEQYWATRALKAEALLAANEAHQRELRSTTYSQEIRRSVREQS